jgi:hypothetical protein
MARSPCTKADLSPAQVRQRQRAALKHGGQSVTALNPTISGMRRGLLRRMGIRQADLSWAAREGLDGYVRAKSKVVCIDRYLDTAGMIAADGTVAGCMKLYFVALASARRHLELLRGIVGSLAAEDRDLAGALAALDRESGELR